MKTFGLPCLKASFWGYFLLTQNAIGTFRNLLFTTCPAFCLFVLRCLKWIKLKLQLIFPIFLLWCGSPLDFDISSSSNTTQEFFKSLLWAFFTRSQDLPWSLFESCKSTSVFELSCSRNHQTVWINLCTAVSQMNTQKKVSTVLWNRS